MFCVDKIKYEHLAILSNLKNCQYAPRMVIFNLCIYVANLRICRLIFRRNFSLYCGTFRIFRKPNQELLYQTTFWCGQVLNGLMHAISSKMVLDNPVCLRFDWHSSTACKLVAKYWSVFVWYRLMAYCIRHILRVQIFSLILD